MDTVLVQLTNPRAALLLHELEEMNIIKVVESPPVLTKKNLSDRFKGILSPEEGKELNRHIHQMREEWSNT